MLSVSSAALTWAGESGPGRLGVLEVSRLLWRWGASFWEGCRGRQWLCALVYNGWAGSSSHQMMAAPACCCIVSGQLPCCGVGCASCRLFRIAFGWCVLPACILCQGWQQLLSAVGCLFPVRPQPQPTTSVPGSVVVLQAKRGYCLGQHLEELPGLPLSWGVLCVSCCAAC